MEKLQLWFLVLAGLVGAIIQEDLLNKAFVFPGVSNNSYVILKSKPEQPLQNFTLCLMSYTDLSQPYTLFSYATKAQDNEILLFKPQFLKCRLYVGGKFVTFKVPEIRTTWNQICTSWESATGIVTFWVNRKALPRKSLQKGYSVGSKAVIFLGQGQDSAGDGFERLKSFEGEITGVYMWDRAINPYEISADMIVWESLSPIILNWRNMTYETVDDVVVKPVL